MSVNRVTKQMVAYSQGGRAHGSEKGRAHATRHKRNLKNTTCVREARHKGLHIVWFHFYVLEQGHLWCRESEQWAACVWKET